MTNYEFVIARLEHMGLYPNMWGSSQESFGLQLVLLAEFAELDVHPGNRVTKDQLMRLVFGPGNIVQSGPLEDAWARERIGNVRNAIKQG